jgi:hypothetical protein
MPVGTINFCTKNELKRACLARHEGTTVSRQWRRPSSVAIMVECSRLSWGTLPGEHRGTSASLISVGSRSPSRARARPWCTLSACRPARDRYLPGRLSSPTATAPTSDLHVRTTGDIEGLSHAFWPPIGPRSARSTSTTRSRISRRELSPSFVNTFRRCHSTVRELINNCVPISEFVSPFPASLAICTCEGFDTHRL